MKLGTISHITLAQRAHLCLDSTQRTPTPLHDRSMIRFGDPRGRYVNQKFAGAVPLFFRPTSRLKKEPHTIFPDPYATFMVSFFPLPSYRGEWYSDICSIRYHNRENLSTFFIGKTCHLFSMKRPQEAHEFVIAIFEGHGELKGMAKPWSTGGRGGGRSSSVRPSSRPCIPDGSAGPDRCTESGRKTAGTSPGQDDARE